MSPTVLTNICIKNFPFLCYLCVFIPLSQKNKLCLHIFTISLGGTLIFVSTKLVTKTNKVEIFFCRVLRNK